MKQLNRKLKYLIIPITIITVMSCIIMYILTYNQYRKLSNIFDEKIANVVGILINKYPEIDSKEIIKVLNSNKTSNEFEIGKEELFRYGIDINEVNSIVLIENQMKNNLILNSVFIIIFSAVIICVILIYLRERDKKINNITQYINKIKDKKYELNIDENSEDALSNLKNELYKITIMLKEESEISRRDKENLKMSVEDISHQLKTPLTSITIMLDNLKDNPDMDENIKQRFIFEISKQIDWINWLVISMLKLSKLDANVVQFFNEKIYLKDFFNDIIKSLEIPIEIKNQDIVVVGNESSSFIGDYKWQKEAFTNIIKNCIEHNIEDGKIYINYEENNLFTKITIKDEGKGIAKEDLKHIFERFYKGKNSSENSVGIGLSLAKNIIEKNNGMISCKSELEKGTEFIIKYMK